MPPKVGLTQRKNLHTLAEKIEEFLHAKEAECRKKAGEGYEACAAVPAEIAKARKVLEDWSEAEFATELEGCSNIRERYFRSFLEARGNSKNSRVLSEQWLGCEEVARFYLELSKLPSLFLTPERIQEMASQDHMQKDESSVKHNS